MTSWALNHLWQTTLVVLLIALFVKVIGLRHARIRHAIWLATSIKFLVPFSVLVTAGQAVGVLIQPVTIGPRLPASFEMIGQPFTARAVADAATAPASSVLVAYLLPAAVAFWLVGCAVTLGVRWTRWRHAARTAATASVLETGREVDALRRVLTRSKLGRHVTVRLTEGGSGPGLFGVARPVLLWPAGLSQRLTDDAIDAIVAHELSHLRRADNLASLVHTMVEALFWFHPLVWWLSQRLVEDRERACDEDVLSLGTPPQTYARSLLDVCRFSLGVRVPFIASAAGSPLAQRVEAIMMYRTRRPLGFGRRLLLMGAGLAAVLGPLAVGVGHAQPEPIVPPRSMAALQDAATRDTAGVASRVQIKPPPTVTPPRDPKPATERDRIAEFRRGALSTDTPGLDKPVPIRQDQPRYTADAMRAKIQGTVELEVVVMPDGRVGRVRVVRSLDPALDARAIAAARQWMFEPARLNGQAVAVLVTLVLDFRLY